MKKIGKSKNPSVRQMLNMASNLEEKFGKCSMVQVNAWHFSSGLTPNRPSYSIYVENILCTYHDSWKETLERYFSVMEGDFSD